jgi:hypothetical protein
MLKSMLQHINNAPGRVCCLQILSIFAFLLYLYTPAHESLTILDTIEIGSGFLLFSLYAPFAGRIPIILPLPIIYILAIGLTAATPYILFTKYPDLIVIGLIFWFMASMAGVKLGLVITSKKVIEADHKTFMIRFMGPPLISFLCIAYFIGFCLQQLNVFDLSNHYTVLVCAVLYSLSSGYLLGEAVGFWRLFKHAPHIDFRFKWYDV